MLTVKVLQNEIFGGGKNGREERMDFAIRRRRANWGGAKTLRKEKEEELFMEMLTPT